MLQGGAIVVRPILATLVLHGLLIWALLANWQWLENNTRTVKPRVTPPAVQATLVDASTLKPKAEKKPAWKPTKKPDWKPIKKSEWKPTPKIEKKAQRKPVTKVKRKAAPKPKPKPKPKMTVEELAAQAKADLNQMLSEEEAALQTLGANQRSISYQAMIQQAITRNWSRPPSARNGMETVLVLQLVPTGEIVNVSVVKSSGDPAFDRSAVNAVKKAGRFEQLQNLPVSVFERDFRRLRILFKPEDLRY